jgi:hypothetical protein
MRIWWLKRWKADGAGKRDAGIALGLMTGEPSPFIEELQAEWEEERNKEMARLYDDQQRMAGRTVRIPIVPEAARGVTDPNERRRLLAEAGSYERFRLDMEAFWHRLAARWAPYARVVARYRGGFLSRFPADADVPPELLRARGLPDDFDDHGWGAGVPALPPGPRRPMGFAPAGKKNNNKDKENEEDDDDA